jgi:hypothetical protein
LFGAAPGSILWRIRREIAALVPVSVKKFLRHGTSQGNPVQTERTQLLAQATAATGRALYYFILN